MGWMRGDRFVDSIKWMSEDHSICPKYPPSINWDLVFCALPVILLNGDVDHCIRLAMLLLIARIC